MDESKVSADTSGVSDFQSKLLHLIEDEGYTLNQVFNAAYVLWRRIIEKDMPKGLRTGLHYWPVLMSLGHVSLCLFIEVKNHI